MPGARKIIVVAVALLLVAGACGGGDDKKDAAKPGDEPGATMAEDTTTSSSTPGTDGGGSATTVKPGAGTGAAGGASAGGATTTTKPGSAAATTASGSPRFAAAGGYVVKRTGKRNITGFGEQALDGEGRLSVDRPSGDDQHSFLSFGESDAVEQTLRSKSGAIELVHLKNITQLGPTEFRPSPPVLFAPDPLVVGRTWSWRMTSTDGKVTVDGSFKAVRSENVAIGGEQVAATVVEASITFSGDITGTSKQTVWGSPKYRLAVRTDEVTDLTKPFVLHSESRSELASTKPS